LTKEIRLVKYVIAIAFGMRCGGWDSPGKKTLGYRERDPQQRQTYLRLRERYRRRGNAFG
jgi:hypothetical protein